MSIENKNLFIDIETIGFPEKKDYYNYYDPSKYENLQYYNNARIIEIGFMIYDDNRNNIKSYSSLLNLDNFTIKNIPKILIQTNMKDPDNYVLEKLSNVFIGWIYKNSYKSV